MEIDNRLFIPFVAPFVLLGFFHIFFWIAGVEVEREGVALAAPLSGSIFGGLVSIALLANDVSIGSTRIFKKSDPQ